MPYTRWKEAFVIYLTRVGLMSNNGRKVWVPEFRDTYVSLNPIGQTRLAFPHEVRKPNRWTDIDSVRYICIGQHSFHALDCTGSAAPEEAPPVQAAIRAAQHLPAPREHLTILCGRLHLACARGKGYNRLTDRSWDLLLGFHQVRVHRNCSLDCSGSSRS